MSTRICRFDSAAASRRLAQLLLPGLCCAASCAWAAAPAAVSAVQPAWVAPAVQAGKKPSHSSGDQDRDRHHHDDAGDAAADIIVGGLVEALLTSQPDANPDFGLAPGAAAALRGQGLDWMIYPSPDLYAGISLWDVMTGSDYHGKKMQQQNGLEDPAAAATQALQEAMVKQYAMSPAPGISGVPSDDLGTLTYVTSPGRYLLSVQSKQWGVERYTLRPGRYYVELALRLRLVDTIAHTLMAQGSCHVQPEYDGDAPTKGELLAQQGALLKKLLQTDVDKCVAMLGTYTLGLIPAKP